MGRPVDPPRDPRGVKRGLMEEFLTLAGHGETETRVRGSRFLAIAYPALDEADARGPLEERRRRFSDATHHCAAWRFREGAWRALDAGEPAGAAGAPILAAVAAAGLVNAAVVVTRYFGGSRLGVGGLVRAYGEAAALALDAAPLARGIPAARTRLTYGYEYTSTVTRALERFVAHEVVRGYALDGRAATVDFTVPRAEFSTLHAFLEHATGGRLRPERVMETVLYLKGSP